MSLAASIVAALTSELNARGEAVATAALIGTNEAARLYPVNVPEGVALPYSFKIAIEGRWRKADIVWNLWPQLGIQFVK